MTSGDPERERPSRPALAYTAMPLDRAPERRADAWLRDGAMRMLPLWRDGCLLADAAATPAVVGGERVQASVADAATPEVLQGERARALVADGAGTPVVLRGERAQSLVADAAVETILLGFAEDGPVVAADLSAMQRDAALEAAGADDVADVRRLWPTLAAPDASTWAYARGILRWARDQRFCGRCGAATEARQGGHVRVCTGDGCGAEWFPRIDPAVIVVVEAPGPPRRCLLARHQGAAPQAYSTLAGFVEVGESLEEAVVREVREETGVAVASVAYHASQPWPFPRGLMVGFHARALGQHARACSDEIVETGWFTVEEVADRLRLPAADPRGFAPDAIDRLLLETWVAGG